MQYLREFVAEQIFKDGTIYENFKEFLKKEDLDIEYVLFEDEEDLSVLKLFNDFFSNVNYKEVKHK